MGFRNFGQPFGRGGFGRPVGQGGGASNPNAGYTLYDRFSTALAAGSVNGTLADTGQVRTVIDTNNVLSIAGGVASFATGGVSAGNPGLWYPQMVRVSGMALLGVIIVSGQVQEFGWDNSQVAGGILDCLRLPTTGTLGVRDNNSVITVDTVAAFNITTIQVVIITRAAGSWFFIKGHVYTNWTLVWVSIASTGNLFPASVATNSTTIATADNIRIPIALYIPTPLAYDTFTRANGALGSTEAVGPDAQVLTAIAWAFTAGIWAIVTNRAVATPVLGADVIINGAFAADTDWTKGAGWSIAAGVAAAVTASSDLSQTVPPLIVGRWYSVTYTVSGFSLGTVQAVVGGVALPTHAANGTYTEVARAGTTAALLRGVGFSGSIDNVSAQPLTTAELFATVLCSSADVIIDKAITLSAALNGLPDGSVVNLDNTSNPQNFIIVYLDGKGNCVCEECVAGVFTTKFTAAVTYSVNAVLRVVREGTRLLVFYNNIAVSTVQTMTANVNMRHGMFGVSALNSGDSGVIWPRGTSNEFSALDAF